MNSHRFGFLDTRVTYRFASGEIRPVPEFDANRAQVDHDRNKDGFIYPPTTWLVGNERKRLPNTARPAHLHKLPASHEIRLNLTPPTTGRHRADASTIMHLVAYLHGACFQFEDWWFDARVPLGQYHNIHFTKAAAEHFLSHAYHRWQGWKEPTQRRFTNILFMLNRAPSYEWDWEHFAVEYMVLDACYKTAVELVPALQYSTRNPKKPMNLCGHNERIERMSSHFGLRLNAKRTTEFVTLRNDLLHEALWDHAQPGTAASIPSFIAPLDLRRLNQRLVLALLGYDNDYMRSGWWFMGTRVFGIP